MSAAFYCVADDRYFLGAVGLVNSLRLVGHSEPIRMLDCGLTEEQRGLLDAEVELIDAPAGAPPTLLKTIAPLARPAQTMVLIDTDMIVTRHLGGLLARAGEGNVVAVRNDTERFVPEWSRVLDLPPVRRQPYVSFALVALSAVPGEELLRGLERLQARIDFDRTYWREQRITDYPLLYADQDVLNALLASELEPGRLDALEQRLAPLPPFAGLRIADELTLRCAYADGTEPFVVHHWLAKPWLEPTHDGVYSRLLRRLLAGADVAVRVPERLIPLRLRPGLRALAERKRIDARERWRYHVSEPLAARRRARP